jgi:hypothetical protein
LVAKGADDRGLARLAILRPVVYIISYALAFLLVEVGIGFGLGCLASVLGWRRPPSQTFFTTLAPIGAALFIAFAVVASQLLPALIEEFDARSDAFPEWHQASELTGEALTKQKRQVADWLDEFRTTFITMPTQGVTVTLAGLVGIGTCLALVDAPLSHSHWWLMALTGIAIVTIGALGVVISVSTALYALLSSTLRKSD